MQFGDKLSFLLIFISTVRLHAYSVRPRERNYLLQKRDAPTPSSIPPVIDQRSSTQRESIKTREMPGARAVDDFLKNPYVELFSVFGILVSCAGYAVDTLEVDPATRNILNHLEDFISTAVASEWFLRFYSRDFDPRYLIEPLAVVDFLSFITLAPFINGNFAFLRLLRILRFQRILVDVETFYLFRQTLANPWGRPQQYHSDTTTTTIKKTRRRKSASWGRYSLRSRPVLGESAENIVAPPLEPLNLMREDIYLKVARFVTTVFTLLFVASGCIYSAEHDVNGQNFPDFFSALYFGLTTLTTVGFGDIVPVTPEGRLVVSFSILFGIAVIPAQVSDLAEALLVSANIDMMERSRFSGSDPFVLSRQDSSARTLSSSWDDRASLDTTRLSLYLEPDEDDDLDEFENKVNKIKASSTARRQRRKRERYMSNAISPRSSRPLPCSVCGEKAHFKDAIFCFRCGNNLY
uniref:Potassium channel domain-containing protein n=1 Tax=Aureoumbra lagunensis TaxID=44058 RepID=A0A7S3JMQ8_9STRA|mmetsp:Transcript_18057/g.27229  ORF Transcript_18057/g.27229 Transcript_18057/m.27229 type:complete len:465 (+) Transcript_18057:92-1486(+)